MSDRVLVVIPARDEGPRIGAVVEGVRATLPAADVVVVDDDSTDDTGAQATAAGALVLRHPFHLGYGAALQTGYKYARRRRYELVVQLDADGQHDPTELPGLLAPVQRDQADVVLGSRFLRPGGYRGPVLKRFGSWLFARLTTLLTGQRITDPTSGFRVLSARAVAACCADDFPADYPDADTLVHLQRAGLRLAEVAARMRPAEGKLSMHRGIVNPVYYVYKMLLSMAVVLLRGRARRED